MRFQTHEESEQGQKDPSEKKEYVPYVFAKTRTLNFIRGLTRIQS